MYANIVLGAARALFGTAPAVEAAEAPEVWWERFGGAVAFDSFVGIGTFVKDRHADDPYWGSTLTITPSYEIVDDLTVGLFFSLTYEWTHLVTPCHEASGPRPAGAPAKDCSDTNDPNGQRFDLLDLELSAKHGKMVEAGPFTLSGFGAVALPTSRASRHADNILSLGTGLTAGVELGPVSIELSGSFYKHFPTAEAAVLDAIETDARADGGTPIGRCASFRQQSCVALQGFVASWNVKSELAVSFELPWVEGLSTSASVAYLYSRRFGQEPDELSSPILDADGDRVVTGTNHDDSTIGVFDVSYAFLDEHLSVSFGIFSWQPARTADGKSVRFPFYDFVSPANNYTTWYLTLSASL
jgi:hypothetical protein